MSARSATTLPGLAAAQHADHAGVRDVLLHLDAERAQVVGDELRRAHLAVAELGVLVDVAAPGDHARLDARRGRIDARVQIGGSGGESGHRNLQEHDGSK